MKRLEFKTNYNVLLWHFVDHMSTWDPLSVTNFPAYFEKEFGFTKEDHIHLKQYAELRSPFLWNRESDLFQWAYLEFPLSDEFGKLLPHIQYFDKRVNDSGVTLKEVLLERLDYINNLGIEKNIERILRESDVDGHVEKLSHLFNTDRIDKGPVTVFLACSMSSVQRGGANGWAIYTEVGIRDLSKEEHRKSLVGVIFHEYLHKIMMFQKYFQEQNLYQTVKLNLSPDELSSLFEEAIVYLISDVYIRGYDIQKRISQLKEYAEADENMKMILNTWLVIEKLLPILEEYFEVENADPDYYREKLYEEFDKIVEELDG